MCKLGVHACRAAFLFGTLSCRAFVNGFWAALFRVRVKSLRVHLPGK